MDNLQGKRVVVQFCVDGVRIRNSSLKLHNYVIVSYQSVGQYWVSNFIIFIPWGQAAGIMWQCVNNTGLIIFG